MGEHIFLRKGLQERKSEIHSHLQHFGLSLLETKESASTKGHEMHDEMDVYHSVGGQTCPLYQKGLENTLDTSIHHSHETKFAAVDNQIN